MKRMINLLSLHCLEKPNSCQVQGQKKKALQKDRSTKHHSEIILLSGPMFLIVTGRRRWRTHGLTIAGSLISLTLICGVIFYFCLSEDRPHLNNMDLYSLERVNRRAASQVFRGFWRKEIKELQREICKEAGPRKLQTTAQLQRALPSNFSHSPELEAHMMLIWSGENKPARLQYREIQFFPRTSPAAVWRTFSTQGDYSNILNGLLPPPLNPLTQSSYKPRGLRVQG